MRIEQVADIIHRIASGFEENAVKCLDEHSQTMVSAVKEQLYSGLDGEGEYLSPTYDEDPFFEEPGTWHHRSNAYKEWKREITPPDRSVILNLPPRPESVPNLFIDGTFYSQINATMQGDMLYINPGSGNGSDIVGKYGEEILLPGDTAIRYFNWEWMLPSIEDFFKKCGYQ